MDWLEQCKSEALDLSKDRRQQVLTYLRSGKTIGEAMVNFELSLAAVSGIVDLNIEAVEFLRRDSL